MTDTAHLAFVCSRPGDDGDGVYGYAYDGEDGSLAELSVTPVERPMYVAVHPDEGTVYVASRGGDGRVGAFGVDAESGELERLSERSSEGSGPCFVSVDAAGEFAFVANYRGGTAAMYPVGNRRDLGEACDVVRHEGSGADPDRQAAPHPHAIVPGPDDRFAYVPDLGLDRVVAYRVDRSEGRLQRSPEASVDLPPGTGPRHLAFGPDGEYGYLVGELDSTVTALARDAETGELTVAESASTLPDGADASAPDNHPADVHVHSSGRRAYVSNRGHDSIAVFDVGAGGLEPLDHVSTGGRNPRDFALDPSGAFLLAENGESGTVVSFAVDGDRFAETSRLSLRKATCLAFVARE